MEIFKDRLKQLRREKNLTLDEMEKASGITKSSLSKYETGQRHPRLELLQILADFFEVSVDYLIGKTDDRNTAVLEHIPDVLREIGVEYIEVAKELKDEGLSPEDIRKIIEFAKNYKK